MQEPEEEQPAQAPPYEARIRHMMSINQISNVSSKDPRNGFVQIIVEDEEGDRLISQVDIMTARKIGMDFLTAAEAAAHDAAVYSLLIEKTGVSPEGATVFVYELREHRQDMREQ